MDFEQFCPKQPISECKDEKFTIGLLAIFTSLYVLIDCLASCRANRKLNALQGENETLKTIILKTMERSLLRMMHQPQENEHED
jgi:hypothetical protein